MDAADVFVVTNSVLSLPTGCLGQDLGLIVFSLLAVPRRLFCFSSLVILDVACCFLWLFVIYKYKNR